MLERHVSSWSLTANVVFIILHLKHAIFSFWQNITIGLAVHSFRSKSGSNQIYVFTFKLLFHASGEFQALNLDQGVLLRTNSFTLGSIVISTWLIIDLWEDSGSISELNFILWLQSVELPPDEGIVVWVHLSSDERTTPVCVETEIFQVLLTVRWEELKPINWILELRDLFFRNFQSLKNFVLSGTSTGTGLSSSFGVLSLNLWAWAFLIGSGCVGAEAFLACLAILDLSSQSEGCCLHWHTSTMEGEGEQNVFA